MVTIRPIAIFLILLGIPPIVFTKCIAKDINRFQRNAFWHLRVPLWWDILVLRAVGVLLIGMGIASLFGS